MPRINAVFLPFNRGVILFSNPIASVLCPISLLLIICMVFIDPIVFASSLKESSMRIIVFLYGMVIFTPKIFSCFIPAPEADSRKKNEREK